MPTFETIPLKEAIEATRVTTWLEEQFGEEYNIDLSEKEKIEEGICTKCGGDDVECLNDCTLHVCIDCNHVLNIEKGSN